MSADIGPGDWVECVRCRAGSVHFVVGGIYQVEAVGKTTSCEICDGCGVGVHIVGKPTPRDLGHRARWISGCAFRPIYRPSSDFIESLKRPVQNRETVRGPGMPEHV